MNKNSDISNKIKKEIEEDIINKYSLLLLSGLQNSPIRGKTKLMKEFFLIAKNIPDLEYNADFEEYSYGPYSEYVDNSLDDLEVLGLIVKTGTTYSLSDLGKVIVEDIKKDISEEEIALVEDMKNLLEGLTTNEALALVYFTYPEETIESIVVHDIKNKRVGIAVSLLLKGKVSISKGAEIAGLPYIEFYQLLKDRGIKVRIT